MVRPLLFSFLASASALACTATSHADGAAPTTAPAAGDFRWQKVLTAATRFEVRSSNGGIRAEAATGDALEIVAVKSGKSEDVALVNVVVKEDDGVVVACALWPGETTCQEGGSKEHQHLPHDRFDARVDFVVRVPAKVSSLSALTMNGGVTARSPAGSVRVRTLNGGIDVTANGPLDAETMNGTIAARITAKGNTARLVTKNGRVELALPADADADVDASTMRGDITSAFGDVPASPFPGVPRAAHFKLGVGGAAVRLETMNGDVKLQRGV